MKSGKCLHEYFSYCGAKQLRRKIVIPPLSSLTLLDTRKFLKRRVPIRSSSVKWDKTFFTRSRDNPSFTSTPPLISKKLVDTSFLPKSGTVPLRIYSVLWDERNLTENRESPPVISKISRSQRFSQKPKGSFTKFFCHVRKQFFDGKSRYSIIPPSPFSYPKYSSKPIFSQTREKFASNLLGTVRQNNFDGKSWNPLFYL